MLPRDEAPGTGAPQRSRVDEVAKSNSTLNLFLGTRQPRWMDAAKPVGPTPRQTHSQPPQPQAAAPTGAQGDGQPGPPQARRREHIQAPHPYVKCSCQGLTPLQHSANRSLTAHASPPEHSILPSPAPSDEATPQADRETPHASPAVMQMPSQQGDAGSPPGHAAPAARFVFDPGSPDPLALPDDPSAPRNVRHASTESRTAASLPSRDEEVPGGGSAAAETAAGAGGVAAGEGAGEGAADDGQHPMTECTAQQRPANPPELLQKPAVMAPGEAATTEASKEFSDVEITGERSASRPPNDM